MQSKRLTTIKEFCKGCRDLNYPSTLSSLKFSPDVHTYAHTHRDTHIDPHVYIYISLCAHMSIPVLIHAHTHTHHCLSSHTVFTGPGHLLFMVHTSFSSAHTTQQLSSLNTQLTQRPALPFQQLQQTNALFSDSNELKFPCSC